MNRARKALIVQEAPVTEYESVVAKAMENVAESLADVAGALCYNAATSYIGTAGEQRQIAATMFHMCRKRFGGVKYDGQKIEDMSIRELDDLWHRLIGGRPKR